MSVRTDVRVSKRYRLFEVAEAEKEALKADIKKRGLIEPIEIDEQGVVLDGHLRMVICRELGITPHYVERAFGSEEEKIEHILKRKLLFGRAGPVSCGRAIARLLEVRGIERGQGSSAGKRWSQSATFADLASEIGIPERTIRYHLQLADDLADHPKLARAVDRGEVTVRAALLEVGNGHGGRVRRRNDDEETSHPARFSTELLPVFVEMLSSGPRKVTTVLDPFAGTGRIHELEEWGFETTGVEIEPEWAQLHDRTVIGNALQVAKLFKGQTFDAICTSPTYGNRMADHHEAYDPETRRSYRHDLGHPLHKDNSGRLQWGPAYREFHAKAWKEISRVLGPGGLLVLNIKDHIRKGRRQHVAGWHITALCRMGYALLQHAEVETQLLRAGANHELRLPETVYLLTKD